MIPLTTCTLPDTSETLGRLWAAMSDKHSAGQVERHLILLDTFLSATEGFVKMRDLQLLTRATAFLVARAELETRYRDPLKNIFHLLKQPFKMEKASDEIDYQDYMIEFFSTFGCFLLQSKSKDQILDVLEIVEKIVFSKRERASGFVPTRACIKSIEISEFVECLVDLITAAKEDSYHLVLFIALQITLVTKFGCWTMLIKNALESLLVRLISDFDEKRSEVVSLTLQVLWELLRCTDHPEDWRKVPVPSVTALRGLRYVLREEALLYTYPGQCSNGLNNIAALTLKMMHLFPNAEYVQSGLIEDVTFFATLSESVIPIHILPKFKDSLHHLQFKILMLACMSLSPISSSTLILFEQYKVADCVVRLLSGGISCGNKIPFTLEEGIELFKSALPVVCALFCHIEKSFIDAGLMDKLIVFLKVHYFTEKHLPDDLALAVIKTTSFLCFSKMTNNNLTHDALRKADSVAVMLSLSETILEQCGPLTIHYQSMLSHNICVLATLMKNNTELQRAHSEQSLNIVNTLYQRIVKPLPTDSLTDNRLIVAVCNFAWETLVWNKENILTFFSSGNVFTHIDIMEKGPFSVKSVCLAVLADLCEYEQCVPYLVSWRGPGGVKLLSLLCRIWRAEEERLEVAKTRSGCISDVERPLMGKKHVELMRAEKQKTVSISDVFGSVRPKIYAIVQLLRRHKEVKDICEEHYKLGHDKLPCEDLVTLQIIEAYLPLKMGEIWWEIRLKQGEVLPLDRYLVETLADRYINWSLCVQRSQEEVLRSWNAGLRAEEQELYSRMRGGRLTTALAALREVELIARTADRQTLLRSHRWLCRGVESSRAEVDVALRTAYSRDLNTVLVHSRTDVVLRNESDQSAAFDALRDSGTSF